LTRAKKSCENGNIQDISKSHNYTTTREGAHHGRKKSNTNDDYMLKLRKTNTAGSRSYQIPLPELWRNPDKTMWQVSQVWTPLQVSEMRFYRSIELLKAD